MHDPMDTGSSDPYRDPERIPRFRSRFGGLWTELVHAAEIADGKRQLGLINRDERALLDDWFRDGYVVLRGAVPGRAIRTLAGELEEVWSKGHSNAWVNAIEGVGVTRPLQPGDRDKVDNLVKLLDIYQYLEPARRVIFSPELLRFLHVLFERPALVHQSLSFYRGSKQAIHRDTAFVRTSSPLEFVGIWVALEDVRPGSGELEYYTGSHRLDDFLFEDKYVWFPPGNNQIDDFYQFLEREAASHSCKRERFLPKAGDVLIWNANLAHGGSPYTDSTSTRRSFVCHASPIDVDPMYFRYGGHTDKVKWSDGAYWCAMEKYLWRAGG